MGGSWYNDDDDDDDNNPFHTVFPEVQTRISPHQKYFENFDKMGTWSFNKTNNLLI